MANAFQSLKAGIEADIKLMANTRFIDVDETVINEIYACMRIIKLGKNTVSPINWVEAFRLYGLHNYTKINAFLEKQLQPKQRMLLNINRKKPLHEKKAALESYVAPPPVLLKKVQHAVRPIFDNEYASDAYV